MEQTNKTLFEFLNEQIHKDSPNFENAMLISNAIQKERVFNVIEIRGDGNCFLRAIIASLYLTRDVNILCSLLMKYLIDSDIDLFFKYIQNKNIKSFMESDLLTRICQQIRKDIILQWDYEGEVNGNYEYHMDENTKPSLVFDL